MDPSNGVGFGASESYLDNQYTLASDKEIETAFAPGQCYLQMR